MKWRSKLLETSRSRLELSKGTYLFHLSTLRNYKDYTSYSKETKQLEEKLEKLKKDGADETDQKKMQDLIAETAQMIPNCKTRIQGALEDLENLMQDLDDNAELKETEDWKTAEQLLAEVKAFAETM